MNTKIRTKNLYKTFFVCTLLLLLAVPLSGCSGSNDTRTVSKSNFFFDTVISITLYGTDEGSPIDECFALAKKYENLFSSTVEGSDVWNINHSNGKPVRVDLETRQLIQTGIRYGDISHGRFDITIGKLSELWNFSKIAENLETDNNEIDASAIPEEQTIQTLLPHINYKNIRIDGDNISLKDAEASVDLGGIAKGYIADRMKALLQKKGIASGIINLGGNVLTIGEKKDKSPYRVGVQKPFGDKGEVLGMVQVKDKSVVTSGIYERYFRVDGKLYHHILDTETGYPYENGLSEVTIISNDSVDGDALSTTCFALGLDEGMKLIESLPEIEAIFVDSDEKIYCTSGAKSLYSDAR